MFCPQCGNPFQSQAAFCPSCGVNVVAQRPPAQQPVQVRARIVRPKRPRMLAGVCSGIAIHCGWDVALVRIVLVVAACLTSGAATLFYVAAWILIPEAAYELPPATNPSSFDRYPA
jgi:phage shock protein PspC (stress-responsive transcriptional regulator)